MISSIKGLFSSMFFQLPRLCYRPSLESLSDISFLSPLRLRSPKGFEVLALWSPYLLFHPRAMVLFLPDWIEDLELLHLMSAPLIRIRLHFFFCLLSYGLLQVKGHVLVNNILKLSWCPLKSSPSPSYGAFLSEMTIDMASMASKGKIFIVQYLFEDKFFVLEIDFLC